MRRDKETQISMSFGEKERRGERERERERERRERRELACMNEYMRLRRLHPTDLNVWRELERVAGGGGGGGGGGCE